MSLQDYQGNTVRETGSAQDPRIAASLRCRQRTRHRHEPDPHEQPARSRGLAAAAVVAPAMVVKPSVATMPTLWQAQADPDHGIMPQTGRCCWGSPLAWSC